MTETGECSSCHRTLAQPGVNSLRNCDHCGGLFCEDCAPACECNGCKARACKECSPKHDWHFGFCMDHVPACEWCGEIVESTVPIESRDDSVGYGETLEACAKCAERLTRRAA